MQSIKYLPLVFIVFTFYACNKAPKQNEVYPSHFVKTISSDPFKEYWYQGKAEITSYHLEQARYGEIHQGNAVLVFVTEDFSNSKQVKLDNPNSNPNDAVKVLKLNTTKKFNTGVYPYSMMQSVFTPVDIKTHPHSLKATTSSQEWCGHTFTQLNLKSDHYQAKEYSYFESEGDRDFKVNKTWLEDEIWTRIRIAPETLPVGNIEMIPSSFSSRLKHFQLKSETVNATINDANNTMNYTLDYPNLNRKISINFDKSFPHEINSWEETSQSGWGTNAKTLTTKATKNKSILLDYWSKNGVEDAIYREKLGL